MLTCCRPQPISVFRGYPDWKPYLGLSVPIPRSRRLESQRPITHPKWKGKLVGQNPDDAEQVEWGGLVGTCWCPGLVSPAAILSLSACLDSQPAVLQRRGGSWGTVSFLPKEALGASFSPLTKDIIEKSLTLTINSFPSHTTQTMRKNRQELAC